MTRDFHYSQDFMRMMCELRWFSGKYYTNHPSKFDTVNKRVFRKLSDLVNLSGMSDLLTF